MLPLFCVRRWRVTSSFNFGFKLHHPVQLVCTCGKGFQKEYKPDLKPTTVTEGIGEAAASESRWVPRGQGAGEHRGHREGCSARRFARRWHGRHSPEFMTWKAWISILFATR